MLQAIPAPSLDVRSALLLRLPQRFRAGSKQSSHAEDVEAQRHEAAENGRPALSYAVVLKMSVPSDVIPQCPVCDRLMTVNLRCDGTFAEDGRWRKTAGKGEGFVHSHRYKKMMCLKSGVGESTPGIIKHPFGR